MRKSLRFPNHILLSSVCSKFTPLNSLAQFQILEDALVPLERPKLQAILSAELRLNAAQLRFQFLCSC